MTVVLSAKADAARRVFLDGLKFMCAFPHLKLLFGIVGSDVCYGKPHDCLEIPPICVYGRSEKHVKEGDYGS